MSPNVTFKSLLVQADLKLAVPLQAGGAWRFQEAGSRVAWQAHRGDAHPLLFLQNGRGSTYRQQKPQKGALRPEFSCTVEEGLAFLYNVSKSM